MFNILTVVKVNDSKRRSKCVGERRAGAAFLLVFRFRIGPFIGRH